MLLPPVSFPLQEDNEVAEEEKVDDWSRKTTCNLTSNQASLSKHKSRDDLEVKKHSDRYVLVLSLSGSLLQASRNDGRSQD